MIPGFEDAEQSTSASIRAGSFEDCQSATEKFTGCANVPMSTRVIATIIWPIHAASLISRQKRGAVRVIVAHRSRHWAYENRDLSRRYLTSREGDAANPIPTAIGYKLRLVLALPRILLRLFLNALWQAFAVSVRRS